MKSNKEKIKELTVKMLKESYEAAIENIDKVLNSGAIDPEKWDENYNKMILPKSIVVAILEEEATQYDAKGTSFEKQVKKDAKNIRRFI